METIILPIHILTLIYLAWNIIHADHLGFTWMRGTVPILNASVVNKYHYRTLGGLLMMIITGLFLFYPMREFLLSRPQFYIKMGFVLALCINSVAIGYFSKIPTKKTFASLSNKEKLPLFISGALSTISWIGAALAGLYLIPD